MRTGTALKKKLLIVIALLVVCATASARLINPENLDDIKGAPSTIALATGTKRIHHAHMVYAKMHEKAEQDRYALYKRSHDDTVLRLARAARVAPLRRVALVAVSGRRKPVLKTVTEVPYQNLVIAFATPNHEPVSGLHLAATVHNKDGRDRTIQNLTTHPDGTVTLPKLGPLPVTVDLALTDKLPVIATADTSSTAASSTLPEGQWRFSDVTTASIPILSPQGRPIVTSARVPYEVAGLNTPSSSLRAVIWQYKAPGPIVLERTVADLDILAPPGALLSSPILGREPVVVASNGHAVCQVPLASLSDGPIPIRVAADLAAGQAEAVITEYPDDPYHPNSVTAPELALVSVKNVQLTHNMSVMQDAKDLTQEFGSATVHAIGDGSQMWSYPNQGIQYGVRPYALHDSAPAVVEWVNVVTPSGGNIGGITVGSKADEVLQAFGKPSATSHLNDGMNVLSYVNDGLRIVLNHDRVQSLMVRRRTQLLNTGTDAFVARAPARLFIKSYSGDKRLGIADIAGLKAYLGQLPSIRLVDSQDQADLILDANVSFSDHRDSLISALPYSYTCTAQMVYSLFDTAKSTYLCQNKPVEARSSVDYTKETVVGGLTVAVLLAQKNKTLKLIGGGVALAGVIALNQAVQHAVNKCPALAAETLFDHMVQDIDKSSDFSARVIDQDYQNGTVTINAGSDEGVRVSTPDQPSAFKVSIGGRDLPETENGNADDYYTADVISVDRHTATCRFEHVIRKVSHAKEQRSHAVDVVMLRTIPQAATGEISARSDIRFPPLPVISDAEVSMANDHAKKDLANSVFKVFGLNLGGG